MLDDDLEPEIPLKDKLKVEITNPRKYSGTMNETYADTPNQTIIEPRKRLSITSKHLKSPIITFDDVNSDEDI